MASSDQTFQRVVFARIGWMTFYAGVQPGDEGARGGGSWLDADKHERFNFAPVDGTVYGYFQPKGSGPNLRRIDPKAVSDELRDVLVVFLADQTVVGWYRSAVVHDSVQKGPSTLMKKRDGCGYVCKASIKNAVLLPTRERVMRIPHGKGGTGTANVTYRYDALGREKKAAWISKVLAYVASYKGENVLWNPLVEAEDRVAAIIEDTIAQSSGQGFQNSPEVRRAVETRAMKLARAHYETRGWTVETVGKPYDLRCTSGSKKLYVEVKGTQLQSGQIILTRNEVEFATKHRDEMELFVVDSIRVHEKNGKIYAKGGSPRVIDRWCPATPLLTPISYWYALGAHVARWAA